MISWYYWTRRLAYLSFALGLILVAADKMSQADISRWMRVGFGFFIAAFCLLLLSQAIWVLLILRRNSGAGGVTEEDEEDESGEDESGNSRPTSGS